MDHARNLRDWKVYEHFTSNAFGTEEERALVDVARRGHLTLGPETRQFESEFAAHLNAPHCVAVNSCTSALYLAAQIIGIQPGDEVIVTSQSLWVTAWAALARGATILFADIDPNSLCADPHSVCALLSNKTRAIFVTHFGGYPVDMDPILDAAKQQGAYVVEDCAHAVGALYKGRHVGTLGDIGCFSFGPTKNMTTGEGGMFVTSHSRFNDAAERLRRYVAVGHRRTRDTQPLGGYSPLSDYHDWHDQESFSSDYVGDVLLGHNFRMSEFHAAVGRVQLRKLNILNAHRVRMAKRLEQGLRNIDGIQLQRIARDVQPVYHLFTLFVREDLCQNARDRVLKWLQQEEQIEIILRYFPIHLLPEFRARGHVPGECPVAEKVYFKRQLQLPICNHLTDRQIDYMIEAIGRGVKYARRDGLGD